MSYLADHSLLLALPAFAPAVVVAAVVAWVAIKGRREPDDDDTEMLRETTRVRTLIAAAIMAWAVLTSCSGTLVEPAIPTAAPALSDQLQSFQFEVEVPDKVDVELHDLNRVVATITVR